MTCGPWLPKVEPGCSLVGPLAHVPSWLAQRYRPFSLLCWRPHGDRQEARGTMTAVMKAYATTVADKGAAASSGAPSAVWGHACVAVTS